MRGSVSVVTAPAFEPVTLTQAKAHLRVDSNDENDLIELLIAAATKDVEAFLRRSLVERTLRLTLDRFPCSSLEPIELPQPPALSVTSIQYVDTAGTTQTWSSAQYQVDIRSEPARILPAYGYYYPSTRNQLAAVTIIWQAGYATLSPESDSIEQHFQQAILLTVADLFQNRESAAIGQTVNEIPTSARRLLWPYRALEV